MTYEIYIKEHDDKFLEIGTTYGNLSDNTFKKFGLLCERNLHQVKNGIEAALNSIRAIEFYGEGKALKDGDIDVDFLQKRATDNLEKVKVDYRIVLK